MLSFFTSSLALCLLTSHTSSAREIKASTRTPTAFSDPTALEVTQNYLSLRKTTTGSRSFAWLKSLATANGTAPLAAPEGGAEFAVNITFDKATYEVIVDSGSSDTWLAQSGFTCIDEDGNTQPEADCYFGPLFQGTFEEGQIADENFNISYGDGEFLTGTVGYEDVTVAGITVKHQEVALVNLAFWEGDNVTSGLMGLAYEALTSAFNGTDPEDDNIDTNQVEYSPIFTTMVSEGLVAPMFSLALERNEEGGYIAFGGLPPVSFTPEFSSTPIEIVDLIDVPAAETQYSFYTIYPTSLKIEGRTMTNRQPYIVDSGTTLFYPPTRVAIEILEGYEPLPYYLEDEGAYFVDCDAKAPSVSVEIGNGTFSISSADLIWQTQVDPETGLCLTGVQDGGEGPFILGDTFLQNVVAVFDVGASEMRFAAHNY